MPGGDVIGREPELGLVSGFLDRSVEGSAGFVIEGEPGIGKSTLWLAAVAAARERGLLVVSSRPAEAERGLAHVGLGDLFEETLCGRRPVDLGAEAPCARDRPPPRGGRKRSC